MCEAPDCDRKTYARGLCGRHYKQWQRHGLVQPDRAPTPCAVGACGRRAVTRGWCHGHYLRWSRHRYDPVAAAALGLDLDPETGLPQRAESLPSGIGQQAL